MTYLYASSRPEWQFRDTDRFIDLGDGWTSVKRGGRIIAGVRTRLRVDEGGRAMQRRAA